eukprot:scaffold10788_cov67-Cylindrotheca_fusiformis.AAC.1
MGISSHLCNGTVRASKKNAAKWKGKKRVSRFRVGANMPFIPEVHCNRCRVRDRGGSAALKRYKKGHHKLCPRKPDNLKMLQEETSRRQPPAQEQNTIDPSGNVLAG